MSAKLETQLGGLQFEGLSFKLRCFHCLLEVSAPLLIFKMVYFVWLPLLFLIQLPLRKWLSDLTESKREGTVQYT